MAEIAAAIGPEADILLALCADPDADLGARMAALSPAGREWLADKTAEKRLAPLLYRNLRKAGHLELAGAGLAQQLEAAARAHALNQLRQAFALKRLLGLLAEAGLRPVVLKGVALAYRDYPEPGLRPLRDVDLLLSEADALRAQALLLHTPGYRHAPWAGKYGIGHSHQLPEIQDIEHDLTIEIHHRLNAHGWAGEAELLRLVHQGMEEMDLLGQPVRVPSATANALHLIEHATLHHAFENGPLILADLHMIARSGRLDHADLAARAEALGLRHALHLVAAVAQAYGAGWVSPGLSAGCAPARRHLPAARIALLQDRETALGRVQLRRLAARTGGTGLAGALSRMVRPDNAELAKLAGADPASPMRWLGYPTWLAAKGVRYARALRESRQSGGADREAGMVDWLKSG